MAFKSMRGKGRFPQSRDSGLGLDGRIERKHYDETVGVAGGKLQDIDTISSV